MDEGKGLDLEQGAGDQGLMFGFACDETPQLMPMPIYYAHRLMERHAELRRDGRLPWLRPDAKSQVSVRYVDGKPHHIDTVVISTQHREDISHEPLTEARDRGDRQAGAAEEHDHEGNAATSSIPTGRFVIGGPQGDTGLTGRKIIVDTYGGYSRHGGGAFSGKDPSKVDRSAAYAARHVAKNIVAAGLATKCEIQVAYAIGVARPVSVLVETFGTGKISDDRIAKLVAEALRPAAEGHHPGARPAAPDLLQDGGLRPLRARRAGVLLGSDRQGGRAEGGRREVGRRRRAAARV